MSVDIRATRETTAPPEAVLATLRELDPERRHEFWANVKPKHFVVHDSGADFAEVTEGDFFVGYMWERSRYDWSEPGKVTATILDSNVFKPGSTLELRADAAGEGTTRVELHLRREFLPGIKGRAAAVVNHLGGRRLFGWYLGTVLKAVEAEDAPDR